MARLSHDMLVAYVSAVLIRKHNSGSNSPAPHISALHSSPIATIPPPPHPWPLDTRLNHLPPYVPPHPTPPHASPLPHIHSPLLHDCLLSPSMTSTNPSASLPTMEAPPSPHPLSFSSFLLMSHVSISIWSSPHGCSTSSQNRWSSHHVEHRLTPSPTPPSCRVTHTSMLRPIGTNGTAQRAKQLCVVP